DVGELKLESVASADGRTLRPRQKGLPIEHWINDETPSLGGNIIPLSKNDISRSLAINSDKSRFVLGSSQYLQAINAKGERLWQRAVPGTVFAVNITADDRLVVAACADGTVRWYRMDDGHELLALMVFDDNDEKKWVAWTPDGFHSASRGA